MGNLYEEYSEELTETMGFDDVYVGDEFVYYCEDCDDEDEVHVWFSMIIQMIEMKRKKEYSLLTSSIIISYHGYSSQSWITMIIVIIIVVVISDAIKMCRFHQRGESFQSAQR